MANRPLLALADGVALESDAPILRGFGRLDGNAGGVVVQPIQDVLALQGREHIELGATPGRHQHECVEHHRPEVDGVLKHLWRLVDVLSREHRIELELHP